MDQMTSRIRLDLLECPVSRAAGADNRALRQDGETLASELCTYPIIGGIPDLRMPSNRGATSYDDILPEWRPAEVSDPAKTIASRGLTPGQIQDKIVCIAGVGQGTDILAVQHFNPKEIHAVEYSNEVHRTAERFPRVTFYQADVCNLPVRNSSFDLVVSAGIIQHTRSPELAVREMMRTLKPAGILALANFYPPGLHNRRVSMHRLRHVFHRMPPAQAKRILWRNSLLYYWLVKTGLWRLHRRIPIPGILEYCNLPGHDRNFYYENALDYYLPAYRHNITEAEAEDYAAQLGVKATRTVKGYLFTRQP